jgi:ATP-dependent DNA helicase RecG
MKFNESETLELKTSTSLLKEAIISIASILNKHQHGEVVFGVKDDGIPCGQDVSKKTIRDISHAIADNIEPKIFPTITTFKANGKTCIKVQFKGNHIPYFAYGRAYIRVADENRQITVKELESMILKKNNNSLRWDNQLSDTSLNEVNKKVLREFVVKANEVGRLDFKYQNEDA